MNNDGIEMQNKPNIKRIVRIIFGIGLSAWFLYGAIIRPNSWNTLYEEAIPMKDSTGSSRGGYNLIGHTWFQPGNSEFKKYKRGDTVPVFLKAKIIGEMILGDNAKMLWLNKDTVLHWNR